MSHHSACWRSHPDVRETLEMLQHKLHSLLRDELVGLYLGGSLASGDFDPNTSDIDFLAVTCGELTPEALARLAAMHLRLYEDGPLWARELEGSYIPVASVRRHVPGASFHPRLERDSSLLMVQPHDNDWVIHRHILREQGVVLAGPPPAELIDQVSPGDLRQAVRDILFDWWEPLVLSEPHKVLHLGYRYYAVQTMCRMLYTLEYGEIVSKPAAARWALGRLDPLWHGLIAESLAWPRVERDGSFEETRAFIRFTAAQARAGIPKNDTYR